MKDKGFTILELTVSIFILIVGVVGSSNMIADLLTYTRFTADKATASYLTQEGMEITRNIRDSNWIQDEDWDTGLCGSSECQTGQTYSCYGDLGDDESLHCGSGGETIYENSGFYNHNSVGSATIFSRLIEVEKVSQEKIEVCTKTSWDTHKMEACTWLYNWHMPEES